MPLGLFLGIAQLAHHRAQRGLVVRHHGTDGGGGVDAHHRQKACAAVRPQPNVTAAQGQPAQVICASQAAPFTDAAVGRAQQQHAGQQIVHADHRQHVVATGIEQLALEHFFDYMAGHMG